MCGSSGSNRPFRVIRIAVRVRFRGLSSPCGKERGSGQVFRVWTEPSERLCRTQIPVFRGVVESRRTIRRSGLREVFEAWADLTGGARTRGGRSGGDFRRSGRAPKRGKRRRQARFFEGFCGLRGPKIPTSSAQTPRLLVPIGGNLGVPWACLGTLTGHIRATATPFGQDVCVQRAARDRFWSLMAPFLRRCRDRKPPKQASPRHGPIPVRNLNGNCGNVRVFSKSKKRRGAHGTQLPFLTQLLWVFGAGSVKIGEESHFFRNRKKERGLLASDRQNFAILLRPQALPFPWRKTEPGREVRQGRCARDQRGIVAVWSGQVA